MSKTILADVEGFTPLIDIIVQEVGLVEAAVFGRIWRYCQMRNGVCTASLERIAGEIGLSRKTIQRHAKALCTAGYLEDLTPNLRHKPHTYRDTGKVQLQITAQTIVNGQAEIPTQEVGQKVHPTAKRSVRESHQVGQRVLPGRSESPIKKQQETKKKQQHHVVASASLPLSTNQMTSYNTLVTAGVSEKKSQQLAREYESSRILEVCKAAKTKEGIADKPAWIIAALNKGWVVQIPASGENSKTEPYAGVREL